MKILITGGNGFIAKNLFEQMSGECILSSCDIDELDFTDSRKVFRYLKRKRFDVVIHTANYDAGSKYSTKDPAKVLESNLKMFFNLTRCQDYFGKMLYFGSGAEFGRENWKPKMKEDYFNQNIPLDQYGFSKYIMTKYGQLSNNIYNLRLFAVFGKHEDWRVRFISNACCYAVLGLPIRIKQNVFFDYLYINDLIKIIRWFILHTPRRKVYNVCTGQVNDLKTLAEKVIKISGKKLEIIVEKDGLNREYSGDNSLLLGELKIFEFSPIDESIEDLYNWYNSNKHLIKKSQLSI